MSKGLLTLWRWIFIGTFKAVTRSPQFAPTVVAEPDPARLVMKGPWPSPPRQRPSPVIFIVSVVPTLVTRTLPAASHRTLLAACAFGAETSRPPTPAAAARPRTANL